MSVPQAKSSPLAQPRTETELQLQDLWRVVVLNDPVNLMSYVVLVFKKVFGFDETKARRHMLEVHERGRSVVWSGLRETAEAYVFTLQQWHLTAVLSPMKHKSIEVKLSVPVVAPLLDVIKSLVDDLRHAPAVATAAPGFDAELTETWAAELIMLQQSDISILLSLFREDFFSDGVVFFDEDNAECIARACSALRLCLREKRLKSLGDEVLETGEVEVSQLDEPVRKAFMCYLFLATIQELIIQHLDESIIGS